MLFTTNIYSSRARRNVSMSLRTPRRRVVRTAGFAIGYCCLRFIGGN